MLDFDKYICDECVAIHLKKISVVSLDPGHRFGNPAYYYDVFGQNDDDDSQEVINEMEKPIENQISQEIIEGKAGAVKALELEKTLLEMYSCRFTADKKPIHSKVPSIGWEVDIHGCAPVPRIRWIPGPQRQSAPTVEIEKEKEDRSVQILPVPETKLIRLESGGLYAWLLA